MRSCQQAPPEELLQAVDEFNRGDWFECHETLEELWVGEKGELRDLYQGVLQLAVALHHWRNGNLKGALTLLKGGRDCLSRVSDVCQGIDVEGLSDDAGKLQAVLSSLRAERMHEVEAHLILKVRLI